MGKNKELGQEGEQLAAEYLSKKGWEILEMNYRYRRSEIDLIATKNELLIFVEVKLRSNLAFGLPEDFVDNKKSRQIMNAAEHYILEYNWKGDIRFDIISVIKTNKQEIEHIEDAFY